MNNCKFAYNLNKKRIQSRDLMACIGCSNITESKLKRCRHLFTLKFRETTTNRGEHLLLNSNSVNYTKGTCTQFILIVNRLQIF